MVPGQYEKTATNPDIVHPATSPMWKTLLPADTVVTATYHLILAGPTAKPCMVDPVTYHPLVVPAT